MFRSRFFSFNTFLGMRDVTALVLVCALGFVWSRLGPDKPPVDGARKELARAAAESAAAEMRLKRGAVRRVTLVHFANDPSDAVTDAFRGAIEESGLFNLDDIGTWERVRRFLGGRIEGAMTLEDALDEASKESEAVLWGEVDRFETFGGEPLLTGAWHLNDARSGAGICGGAIVLGTREDESRPDAAPGGAASGTGALRGFLAALFVVALPVATKALLRRTVAKRSNGLNAAVLAAYTAADMAAGYFAFRPALSGGWTATLFVFAGLLALSLNYHAMRWAQRIEEDV